MNRSHVLSLLIEIYGEVDAPAILRRLEGVLDARSRSLPKVEDRHLDQTDILLITYPDQVQAPGEAPLLTLGRLADEHLRGLVNTIHVLPFYPSSSDDGFSVADYESVDPSYGDWADIDQLGRHFGLMFDAVLNHTSVQSAWFQGFLRREEAFAEFFIEVSDTPELAAVVRPRTTPLLTGFSTPDGTRSVWTTFSADQADLNYRSPEVLLRVLDILLFYVERGARLIRLDAVGYIWKEIGTPSIHRPQAHAIVGLLRAAIQAVAPNVLLLTETNVAQSENLAYLGNGRTEAHLVYNFALPPLLLHAFHTAQGTQLADWLANLPPFPEGTSLLNVLATHDGIGLNGCRDFLSESEIDQLARLTEAAGGRISWRANPNGGAEPYELNINYMDALDATGGAVGEDLAIRRFMTAHAIMVAIQGVPAIYFHSVFGSRGWHEGVALTGMPRSINREKLSYEDLRKELADSSSLRSRVYAKFAGLLKARSDCPALSPFAQQQVLHAGTGLLALVRGDAADSGQLLCIHNLTAQRQAFDCALWSASGKGSRVVDTLTSRTIHVHPSVTLELQPFESLWLRKVNEEQHATQ